MPHATCTVCLHEAHEMIDSLLMSGGSVRAVAKRFGLSPAAVHRHQHHDDHAKTRLKTDEIERINKEIRKLHHSETAARKRRDNAGALAISRELRNWHILKQKAELAAIGTVNDTGSHEELTAAEAIVLARAVIEGQLTDPAVREWLLQLVERIQGTAEEARTAGKVPEGQE